MNSFLKGKQITFKYTAFTDIELIEKTITLRFRGGVRNKKEKIEQQELDPIKCHGNKNSTATIEEFVN
jgi:hypothetical protein